MYTYIRSDLRQMSDVTFIYIVFVIPIQLDSILIHNMDFNSTLK